MSRELNYAQSIALSIWERRFKAPHPDSAWEPLDTILGVLTQIDNMTADVNGGFVDVWQCGDCSSTSFQLTRVGEVICRECNGRQVMQWAFKTPRDSECAD